MNITLIAPTYLPARRANTIQVMKMAQALVQCGHSVEVLVPESHERISDKQKLEQRDWSALAEQYGLETQFPVRWMPTHARWRSYEFGWNACQRARKNHTDLIYTRLPQAAAIASWLGIPTIYEIHDFPKSNPARILLHLFMKGRGAQRLVIITHALADDLKASFGAKISPPFVQVAPDGVDLARYAGLPSPPEAREKLGVEDRFTVGYTGHLYPGRGIGLILELARQFPQVNFLLAGGEADSIQHWREIAAEQQLDNLIWTGHIPNAAIPQYQAACEIFLMPYQKQVAASSGGDIGRYLSPMKLFEYLACGRVIIASDLPVLREILNPDNAILIPPQDQDAWVAAIRNGLQFPERYSSLASQAQRDALNYTWTARAQKILSK